MFRIYIIGILLTNLFLSCERSNSINNEGNELPKSLEVYRYNFIDKKYCENCIESDFFVAIPAELLEKPDNLILQTTDEKEIKSLLSTLKMIESSHKARNPIDNKFILVFKYASGEKLIYSQMSNGEWLINDSTIVKPKKDILEMIRKYGDLKDMTDYEKVSKGPVGR